MSHVGGKRRALCLASFGVLPLHVLFAAVTKFMAVNPNRTQTFEVASPSYLTRLSPKCSLPCPNPPSIRFRSFYFFLNQESRRCWAFRPSGRNDGRTASVSRSVRFFRVPYFVSATK